MYIYQLDRILLREQLSKVVIKLSGVVLNVGSGTYERYELSPSVKKYIRMDIAAGPNVDVVGRAEKIPFDDATIDGVITTQVFEHVENPEVSAGEISRVMRSEGTLIITVPQSNELHEEPHDYWRYTKYGLVALFGRHGFTLVSMEPRGGYFALRAQMRMRYLIDRYRLHSHPFVGRLASKLFRVWGVWALWRDRRDGSIANRKHIIGWCAVFRKS